MPNSTLSARNLTLFMWFRVLFTARFYYPVFSILFLDLGITLEMFSVLNLIWAVSIVLLEVPSGALADLVGRKKLVVFGAFLYVVEIALILFAPAHGGGWLFAALIVNRILSGAAEACISGADEALAYDSLLAEGREQEWPRFLERLQRFVSLGFLVALVTGAAVYDANFLNAALSWTGWSFTPEMTMRFPLLLAACAALGSLCCALGMVEPPTHKKREDEMPIGEAMSQIARSCRWILQRRVLLVIILAGVAVDNVIRVHLTTYSNYMTAIGIPQAAFGVVSASLSVVTIAMAWWPRRLVATRSVAFNFSLLCVLTLGAMAGLALLLPLVGVVFLVLVRLAMMNLMFFLSHYTNQLAAPQLRATILSVRGLMLNIGYALASLLFAGLCAWIKMDVGAEISEQQVYEHAVKWLAPYFLIVTLLMALFVPTLLQGDKFFYKKPEPAHPAPSEKNDQEKSR